MCGDVADLPESEEMQSVQLVEFLHASQPTEAGDGVNEATRQFMKVCIVQANLTLLK